MGMGLCFLCRWCLSHNRYLGIEIEPKWKFFLSRLIDLKKVAAELVSNRRSNHS